MKLLFDFFPIVLFFIAFKVFDIYVATLVAMGASLLQVAISWFRTRKIEPMHLVSLVVILVFGGATWVLKDELFIKWKPTVLNWLFAVAFLGFHLFTERTVIERMLSSQISLPKPVWRRLSWMWTAFFVVLGCVNLFVVYNFDTETWVNFKLFGMLGLTFGFVVLQSVYLSRYIEEPNTEIKEE